MPSVTDAQNPAPIVYIGLVRRMKTESCAVRLTQSSGRVVSASKIVQGLIDRYLDIYTEELAAQSANS
ncbi:hypothetical protein PMI17_00374 [Pantoea sp. GM01]|nr:hypothetical protein PMI17_00374 [Pantoea sp. GM01]